MRFNVFRYVFRCEDCGVVTKLVEVGLGSLGDLVITWCCTQCQRDIVCRIPMDRVIADIPVPPAEFNTDDMKWLKACHITLESP